MPTPGAHWRLILSGGAAGARNMALDEALLCSAALRHTLRLYWFAPPCLSIGAHQSLEDVDRAACAAAGVQVVRRPSGGRAVLHDGEITYALVGPAAGAVFGGGVLPSYKRIGSALMAACAELGLAVVSEAGGRGASGPSCFSAAAPYEPLAAGAKLAGSAQLRRGASVLQHGSLRLTRPHVDTSLLLRERRAGQRIPADPPSLSELLGRAVSRDTAISALREAFSACFAVELTPGALSAEELMAAGTLEQRYRGADWTARPSVSDSPASPRPSPAPA
jgi:lipoyl(octanoyl) transferase